MILCAVIFLSCQKGDVGIPELAEAVVCCFESQMHRASLEIIKRAQLTRKIIKKRKPLDWQRWRCFSLMQSSPHGKAGGKLETVACSRAALIQVILKE